MKWLLSVVGLLVVAAVIVVVIGMTLPKAQHGYTQSQPSRIAGNGIRIDC